MQQDRNEDARRAALRTIRRMEIKTARLVQGAVSGNYLSTFKGRGIEFNEVREYVEGDDVRAIDWNVTARMGTPYVKTFVEERDLTVILAVDVSGSMGFGTHGGFKSDAAAGFAATVASLALLNNDRVGLVTFSAGVESYVPPRKGRRQAVRIIDTLTGAGAAAGTSDPARAAGFIMNTRKTRATVFWVSDFMGTEDPRSLKGLAKRHEFVPVRVMDVREREFPRSGIVELYDPETGRRGLYDTSSESFRRAVKSFAAEEDERLGVMFRSLKAIPIELRTDEPPVVPLGRYFNRVTALSRR